MSADELKIFESIVLSAARSVQAVAPMLPLRDEVTAELADAAAAQERGYFLPDEDERIRETFARYLTVRAALLETVDSIRPVFNQLDGALDDDSAEQLWVLRLRAFIVGFAAATMLVRSARFIVELAEGRDVVWKKLDEAEPRYGIPVKSYTQVYKSLVSSRRMWRFHEALSFMKCIRMTWLRLLMTLWWGSWLRFFKKRMNFFNIGNVII